MQKHGLIYFMHRFPDDLTCLKHLEKRRWPDGNTVCPHCGHQKKRFTALRMVKRSNAVLAVNDSMPKLGPCENSNIPLQKWYINNYSSKKKGISSVELNKSAYSKICHSS